MTQTGPKPGHDARRAPVPAPRRHARPPGRASTTSAQTPVQAENKDVDGRDKPGHDENRAEARP
jgi:hypothetical protein